MPSDHARAVALAQQAADDLARLFDQVGGVEAPQGSVWRAYRVARQALGERFSVAQLQDVQADLLARVQDAARSLLDEAAQLGQQQARDQLAIYGVAAGSLALDATQRDAHEAVLGALGTMQRQILLTYAATNDPALIIGDGTRVGALGPAPAAALLTQWLTLTHQRAFGATVQATRRAERFQRQALATISKRTTPCCLMVNGQIVGMDEPFRLAGTPRYADALMQPPFHRYCRTVTALVPASGGDDALTQQLRQAARAELTARQQGSTTDRSRAATAIAP